MLGEDWGTVMLADIVKYTSHIMAARRQDGEWRCKTTLSSS